MDGLTWGIFVFARSRVASFRDRADDNVHIRRETGVPVVARQIDRDGFVPRRANKRDHAVPIPSHAACPGDKDE